MKLVIMISKFVEGSGFEYTTEFDSSNINEIPSWDSLDNSWCESLVEDEPEEVDFQCWYEVVDNSEVVASSEKFWARG